jgi:hypothetical protein
MGKSSHEDIRVPLYQQAILAPNVDPDTESDSDCDTRSYMQLTLTFPAKWLTNRKQPSMIADRH